MADNSRDFEIRLKASGGSQAAAEVKKSADAVNELKERITLGADALQKLADETGDGQLKEAAAAMRALFEEAISDAGRESIQVLEQVDGAIGELLVEFVEVKKAEREAAEAAALLNTETRVMSARMADAAQEQFKNRDAGKRLANSLEYLNDTTDKVSGKKGGGGVRGFTDALRGAATQVPILGDVVTALGAGPLAIASAAVTAITVGLVKYKQAMDAAIGRGKELADKSRELGAALRDQKTAQEAANTETSNAATKLENLLTKEAAWNELTDQFATNADKRATAAAEYAKKLLDLQVAQGKITQEDADAQKLAIDKTEIDRKNGDAQFKAASELQSAKADLAKANEALAESEGKLAEATAKVNQEQSKVGNAKVREALLYGQAGLITDPSLSGAGRAAAFGGEAAYQSFAQQNLPASVYELVAKNAAEGGQSFGDTLEKGKFVRLAIQKSLIKQGETAGKQAAEMEKGLDAATQAKDAAQGEVDALGQIKETQAQRAKVASDALNAAIEQRKIDDEFTKPGMDLGAQTAAQNQFNQAQIDAANAAAKAAEEGAKQEIDQRALGIAGEIQNKVATAQTPNTAAGQELLKTLSDVAAKLSDGTDQRELIQVTGELGEAARLAGQLGAEAKALVEKLQKEVAELRSIVETNRGY